MEETIFHKLMRIKSCHSHKRGRKEGSDADVTSCSVWTAGSAGAGHVSSGGGEKGNMPDSKATFRNSVTVTETRKVLGSCSCQSYHCESLEMGEREPKKEDVLMWELVRAEADRVNFVINISNTAPFACLRDSRTLIDLTTLPGQLSPRTLVSFQDGSCSARACRLRRLNMPQASTGSKTATNLHL